MGSRFRLTATLPILVFLQIIHWVSGQHIIPPDNPVIGIVGNGAVLPCQVDGKIIPEKLSVQWIFAGGSTERQVATFYGKNLHNPFLEFEAYRGRTEFFPLEFHQGNLSLLLKNIRLSDRGKYSCIIFLENWYNEVMVELDVAGAELSVSLDGHSGNGISLSCRSQGWFPVPSVVWLDSQGQTRTEEVTTLSTPGSSSGIFDVVSSMNLELGSDREVSCRVVNEVLNATRESRVRIADSFFPSPSPSPWMFASLAVLSLDLGIIGAVVYKIIRSFTQAKKAEPLRAELDFWEARSHAVSVVLDLETWPMYLHNVPYLSWQEVLVAQKALGARKCYWEVELGQRRSWVLGVLWNRERLPGLHSQHCRNFWALAGFCGELFSCNCVSHHKLGEQQDFSVVGVFLDLEKGRLEFYDVERRDLVAVMLLETRKGPMRKFFPFVSLEEEEPLRICRVPIPVPI